jgi:hypothetical protein
MSKTMTLTLTKDNFEAMMVEIAVYDQTNLGWFCKTEPCAGNKGFFLSDVYTAAVGYEKAWAKVVEHLADLRYTKLFRGSLGDEK